jgi:hypothetical protein
MSTRCTRRPRTRTRVRPPGRWGRGARSRTPRTFPSGTSRRSWCTRRRPRAPTVHRDRHRSGRRWSWTRPRPSPGTSRCSDKLLSMPAMEQALRQPGPGDTSDARARTDTVVVGRVLAGLSIAARDTSSDRRVGVVLSVAHRLHRGPQLHLAQPDRRRGTRLHQRGKPGEKERRRLGRPARDVGCRTSRRPGPGEGDLDQSAKDPLGRIPIAPSLLVSVFHTLSRSPFANHRTQRAMGFVGHKMGYDRARVG